MEKVVISLGGSIIIPDDGDGAFLDRLASLLRTMVDEMELYVVCGGGKIARYYIQTGRELGVEEEKLDELGIEVTRLNARLLQLALGEVAYGSVPTTIEETIRLGRAGRVAIMGGTTPGHTTDGVSAELAERVGAARIVNATSVDGVYSADPRKDPGATKYDRLSFLELEGMMERGHGAGSSHVFDPLGAMIVRRSRIPLFIVAGRDLQEMGDAIRGRAIKGTVIDG